MGWRLPLRLNFSACEIVWTSDSEMTICYPLIMQWMRVGATIYPYLKWGWGKWSRCLIRAGEGKHATFKQISVLEWPLTWFQGGQLLRLTAAPPKPCHVVSAIGSFPSCHRASWVASISNLAYPWRPVGGAWGVHLEAAVFTQVCSKLLWLNLTIWHNVIET